MGEHVFTVLESQDWFPHMNPTQRCAVSVPDEMQRTKASRWLPVLSGARSSFWKSILKYRQVKTRTLSICIVNAFSLLKRRCYWSMPRAFLFFSRRTNLAPAHARARAQLHSRLHEFYTTSANTTTCGTQARPRGSDNATAQKLRGSN